jgi:WD repeat-containing protein 23
MDPYFGIWSIKFSGDTKEILASTNRGKILVYDIEGQRVTTRVNDAHKDDINSVCFANKLNSNLIFTGSDDCLIKIWDRRNLKDNRPAGAFVGHQEGVTSIASKGDGFYLASNAKDQLCKYWDIRKTTSIESLPYIPKLKRLPNFDYRWCEYEMRGK